MPPNRPATSRVTDFSDPNVKAGFSERPERFSGVDGHTYRCRVMTLPVEYYGAQVKSLATGKGFFAHSDANIDDIIAALKDNDPEAFERCKQQCELFARGYQVGPRFAVLLYVASETAPRKVTVNRMWPWAFGGQIYNQIRQIVETLPPKPDGKPMPLASIELQMQCTDANWQKWTITPIVDKAMHVSNVLKVIDEFAHEFHDPRNPARGGSPLVDEFIAPEGRIHMAASLDRAEGKGRFAAGSSDPGDAVGGDPVQQPARGGRQSAARGQPATQPATPARGATQPRQTKPREAEPAEADVENLLNGDGIDLG